MHDAIYATIVYLLSIESQTEVSQNPFNPIGLQKKLPIACKFYDDDQI